MINVQKLFFVSSSAAVLSTFIAAGYGSAIASQQLRVNPSATVEVKPCIKLLLASALGFGVVGIASAIAIPKTEKREPIEFDYKLMAIVNRLKVASSEKREFYINKLTEELGGDRFSILELLKAHNLIDETLHTELILWADKP